MDMIWSALESSVLRTRSRFFFFQAEDGIRDYKVTAVQTCALPISGFFTQRSRTLCDGSYLVTLRPKGQPPVTLRVIEYRLHPLVAHDLALLPVSRTCRPADPAAEIGRASCRERV